MMVASMHFSVTPTCVMGYVLFLFFLAVDSTDLTLYDIMWSYVFFFLSMCFFSLYVINMFELEVTIV